MDPRVLQLDPMLAGNAPQAAPPDPSAPAPTLNPAIAALDPVLGGTPDHVVQQVKEPLNVALQAAAKEVGTAYGKGEYEVQRGLDGMDALLGHADVNEVLQKHQVLGKQYQGDLTPHLGWLAPAVESIPMLKDALLGGTAGAATGAGIGAGLGLAGGPFAEVTVPGGAVAGAVHGFNTGSAGVMSATTAGNIYLDLRAANVPDNIAKSYALAGGAAVGALGFLRFSALGNVLSKSAQQKAAQLGVEQVARQAGARAVVGGVVRNTIAQTVDAEAQGFAQATADTVGQLHANGAVPTPAQVTEAVVKAVIETDKQLPSTALMSGLMVGGARGIGHVTGKVLNTVLPHEDPKTLTQAQQNVAAHIENQNQSSERLQGQIEENASGKAPEPATPQDRLNAVNGQLKESAATIDDLKTQLDDAELFPDKVTETQKISLQKRLAQAQQERGGLLVQKKEAVKAGLREDIGTTQTELDRLQGLIDKEREEPNTRRLEGEITAADRRRRKLLTDGDTEEAAKVKVKLDALKAELKQMNSRLANLFEEHEHHADFVKRAQGVLDDFEREEMKAAKAELKDQLERAAVRRTNGKQESKFSRSMEDDTQKTLSMIDALVKGKADQLEISEDDEPLFQEAKQLVGEQATAKDVAKLAEDVSTIIDDGLQDRLKEVAQGREQVTALRETVIDAQTRGVDRPSNFGEHVQWLGQNSPQWVRRLGGSIFSFDGQMAALFQKLTGSEFEAATRKFSVSKIVDNLDTAKREQLGKLKDRIAERTGMKDKAILKRLVQNGRAKFLDEGKAPEYIGHDGDSHKLVGSDGKPLSRAQAVEIWMRFQEAQHNDGIARGLQEGNGFTFEANSRDVLHPAFEHGNTTEAVVNRLLSDADKQLAEGIMDFYDKDNYPRLADEYRSDTGLNLPKVERYAGYARRKGFSVDTAYGDFLSHFGLEGSAYKTLTKRQPGIVQKRVDSGKPLAFDDPFKSALWAINHTEQYRAWRQPSKILSRVFQDGEVQEAVTNNLGEGAIKSIDRALDEMINGTVAKHDIWIDTFNDMMKGGHVTILGVNPLRYIKHVVSVYNFAPG